MFLLSINVNLDVYNLVLSEMGMLSNLFFRKCRLSFNIISRRERFCASSASKTKLIL